MMDFVKNLLISITSVSIFCTVILHIIGEKNSQKEIVKIACGCLMIISLVNPIYMLKYDFSESFIDFSDDYINIEHESLENMSNYTLAVVKTEIENIIFDKFNVNSNVFIDTNSEIVKITLEKNEKLDEISSFLGISVDKIEYIESR